jgi:hypothetical protein
VIAVAAASSHNPMAWMNGTPRPETPVAVRITISRSVRSAIPMSARMPRPSARARA